MAKAVFKPLADTFANLLPVMITGEAALDTAGQSWLLKQPDGSFKVFSAATGAVKRRGKIEIANTIPKVRSRMAGAQLRIEGLLQQDGWTIVNDTLVWDAATAGYSLVVGMNYEIIYIPSAGEAQVRDASATAAAAGKTAAEALNVDADTATVGVATLATAAEIVTGVATGKIVTAGAFGTAIAEKRSASRIAALTLLRAATRLALGTWNELGAAVYESFVSGSSTLDAAGSSAYAGISGGNLRLPLTDQVAVDGVLGTIITDVNQNSQEAFDADFFEIKAGAAIKTSTQSAFIGKNWGATPKQVTGIYYTAPTNARIFDNAGQATFSAVLEGSADGVAWTTLGGPWTETNSVGLAVQRNIGEITYGTPYAFHRMRFYGAGSAMDFCISGLRFEERVGGDIVAQSTAITATSQPETVFLSALIQLSEGGSVTNDMVFQASRDGGTTWKTAPAVVFFDGGAEAGVSCTFDMSGQPTGTSVKWRITRKNFIYAQVKALSLSWW